MRRLAPWLAAALLLAPAGAQTLDEVLDGYLRARGGLAKLKAVQTVRMSGTLQMGPGVRAPFTLEMKRPNSMRIELTLRGENGVQAFDGRSGWIVMPFAGVPEPRPMPPEESRAIEEQADFDGPLVDWKAKGHTLELIGTEQHGGVPAFKLKLALRSGRERYIYLGKDSLLEIGSQGRREFRGNAVEFESIVGDYREVDGLMVPFSIESGPKDQARREKMLFEKVEFGARLDDARFLLPSDRQR